MEKETKISGKNKLREINKTKQLIVEGDDEEKVFEKILKKLGLTDIQIQSIGGKDNIGNNLRALKAQRDFHIVNSIAIIRDANDNPKNSFKSVQKALENAILPVPNIPNQKASNGKIETSIFIMPDGCGSKGMIETLFVKSIEDEKIYRDCVTKYLSCANEVGFETGPKSAVYAYISVQKEPDSMFGISVQKGYWDLSHPCFNKIKEFLRNI
jgi:hypothetical protein